MVKAPWNRNRTRPSTPNIPTEVEEYYQSTQKERRGIAWLLSLVTLVLTILIALILFFGGRWIYNKLFNNNNQTESSQQESTNSTESASPDKPTQNEPDTNQGNNSDQDIPGSDQTPANPDSAQQNSSNNPQQSTPTAGPETPEIPRTGPDGND